MSYDFYVDFHENLTLEEMKEWINEKWSNIKRNSRIKWNKKSGELRKNLEDDKAKFHEIVTEFLKSNEKLSPTQYAKFQKIFQNFVEENEEELKNHIHSILQKDIRGYDLSKSPIGKLDLSENPKQAYINLLHPRKDAWFKVDDEIKRQIKNLEMDPRYIDGQKIEQFLQNLPAESKFIKIKFTLKKPYISQDDEEFYIIDNPICKEKIFQTPLVRPSSWKGALRYSAMKNVLGKKDDLEKVNNRIIMLRLFGNEKETMKEFLDDQFEELKNEYKKKLKEIYNDENPNLRGRLVFYPTFFDQIGLDVITPHDRETKTPAKGPIYFETVPPETTGTFHLLYFPFDLIDKEEKINAEQKEDLNFLIDSIIDMFTKYGFGAKTTSGYGIVKNEIKFKINNNSEKEGTFENLKEYIKELHGVN